MYLNLIPDSNCINWYASSLVCIQQASQSTMVMSWTVKMSVKVKGQTGLITNTKHDFSGKAKHADDIKSSK